jgi:hypothetical protein
MTYNKDNYMVSLSQTENEDYLCFDVMEKHL